MPVIIEAHITGDPATVLEGYEHTVAPPNDSRILHVNVPNDKGFTIIEVWESQEALQRFLEDDLPPIWEAVRMGSRMTEPPRWTIRPVHRVAVCGRPPATAAMAEGNRKLGAHGLPPGDVQHGASR